MERYYSDILCQGLRLIYFQADPSGFAEGAALPHKYKGMVKNEDQDR